MLLNFLTPDTGTITFDGQPYSGSIVNMGVKNVFYISRKEFDFCNDAWVDYVHPSDIGMNQKALVVKDNLMQLFSLGF